MSLVHLFNRGDWEDVTNRLNAKSENLPTESPARAGGMYRCAWRSPYGGHANDDIFETVALL